MKFVLFLFAALLAVVSSAKLNLEQHSDALAQLMKNEGQRAQLKTMIAELFEKRRLQDTDTDTETDTETDETDTDTDTDTETDEVDIDTASIDTEDDDLDNDTSLDADDDTDATDEPEDDLETDDDTDLADDDTDVSLDTSTDESDDDTDDDDLADDTDDLADTDETDVETDETDTDLDTNDAAGRQRASDPNGAGAFTFETEKGTNNIVGLVLGLAAVVIIAVAAGVWYHLKQDKGRKVVTFEEEPEVEMEVDAENQTPLTQN
mmetsp:Transcript_56475/g.89952  ORF Transcript_56475/g.89952 Transcript_56475/m.89952 type:complete len:264 (-) Transcript_56475:273-1064(-)|eukprot:CAMPEP_0197033032 /NCGR_PEP_ID=MMETSP1384-20130603/11547_1 /TAXON_ID=29189 /ORGANISM="Ammonia sp." /LENGTH=263 /DNA_ID=CAMNT_0042462775 /DNA_START=87 /DNA_END=878 /DNA_ORIENTATION=+